MTGELEAALTASLGNADHAWVVTSALDSEHQDFAVAGDPPAMTVSTRYERMLQLRSEPLKIVTMVALSLDGPGGDPTSLTFYWSGSNLVSSDAALLAAMAALPLTTVDGVIAALIEKLETVTES
jgi:hypothetical protein